jgi:hypothetical protein
VRGAEGDKRRQELLDLGQQRLHRTGVNQPRPHVRRHLARPLERLPRAPLKLIGGLRGQEAGLRRFRRVDRAQEMNLPAFGA